MTIDLREATASQEIPLGQFLDSSDGDTEESGLTIANTDIKIWKSGATTLANKNSGGATYISNGVYYAVFDATDTNTLGSLVIFIHVSGALVVKLDCRVLPANVYDSLYSTDKLQVHTVEGLSALATQSSVDTIDSNVDAILVDTGTTIPGLISTAQNDLDIITGTDGTTLATAQGNYAPNTVVPDVAGTAATLHTATDADISAVKSDTAALVTDLAKVPKSDGSVSLNSTALADIADSVLDETMSDLADNSLNIGESITLRKAARGLFNRFFREVTQTATFQTVKNDSATTVAAMAVSDDATTQTKGAAT